MTILHVKSAAARRIAKLAARRRRPVQSVLDSALSAGLAYEEWFEREVLKGLSEIEAGKVVSHERTLENMARRKAAFARGRAKAA